MRSAKRFYFPPALEQNFILKRKRSGGRKPALRIREEEVAAAARSKRFLSASFDLLINVVGSPPPQQYSFSAFLPSPFFVFAEPNQKCHSRGRVSQKGSDYRIPGTDVRSWWRKARNPHTQKEGEGTSAFPAWKEDRNIKQH